MDLDSERLWLMKRMKAYPRLTIEAAIEGSRSKALLALTLHPLVGDSSLAHALLDEFCQQHTGTFPRLE